MIFLVMMMAVVSSLSPIVIVNQTNGYTLYYDLSNKIECHNYTDIWGFPLVAVADDFVIPAFSNLDMKNDCLGLSFNFTTIRLKVDTDPYSITTRLFYHDEVTNGPRNTSFFKRTQCAPDNNTCRWSTRLNVPITTTISIYNGDMDDDNITVFDLSSLPQAQTIWASIYVSVPDHPSTSILRENNLFWMTLDNKSTSTPIQHQFYNETPNHNYKYIDVNNLHKNGFIKWTDATVVQPVLGIHTNTFNMAWTVSLLCNGTNITVLPIIQPTAEPTTEPTSEPTSMPTNAPTLQPTSAPTNPVIITTPAPTIIDNITDAPTVNDTAWYENYLKDRQTQMIVYSVLGTFFIIICLSCITCLCLKYLRYRKRKDGYGLLNVDEFLGKAKDRDIELGPLSTSYSDYHDEKNQSIENDHSLKKRNLPPDSKSWTSKDTYSEVALSDHEEMPHDASATDWVYNIIPTDVGVIGHKDTKKTM